MRVDIFCYTQNIQYRGRKGILLYLQLMSSVLGSKIAKGFVFFFFLIAVVSTLIFLLALAMAPHVLFLLELGLLWPMCMYDESEVSLRAWLQPFA